MVDVQLLQHALSSSHVLGELPAENLEELSRLFEARSVVDGERVVEEHEEAADWYLILEGTFRVCVRQGPGTLERELRRLGPGDHFGEIAVLSRGRRTASVEAVGPGRVASLPAERFRDRLHKSPSMAVALCEVLSRHILRISESEGVIPFKRIADFPEAVDLRGMLPFRVAQFCRAAVISRTGDRVLVAMADAYDGDARHFISQVLRPLVPDFVNVSESELRDHLSGPDELPEFGESTALEAKVPGSDRWEPFGASESDMFLERIFTQALGTGSSDVHLDTRREVVTARMRCQGRLVEVEGAPREQASRVFSRLRILANVEMHSRWMPQDGNLLLRSGGQERMVRFASVPSLYGEKVALRFLERGTADPGELARLFPARSVRSVLEEWLFHQNGLLLVTGSTGSGKTTSLYGMLNALHAARPAANILTIEDPVDRELPFATQIPVHPESGRTFAHLLRAVLRQDPEVLMVGEIRDADSAAVSLEAATTGHLVLASMHTGGALEAVARLQSLGIARYLIADALTGVLSQRLLPRVCAVCSAPVPFPEQDGAVRAVLLRQLVSDPQVLRRGRGCDICQGTGNRGMIAAAEWWTPSPQTRRLLAQGAPVEGLAAEFQPLEFAPSSRHLGLLLESGQVAPESVI